MPIRSTLRASLPGIDFNTTDDDGVTWGLDRLTGWGSPASTGTRTQKSRDHGTHKDGPGYLAPRSLGLSGLIEAPTADLASAALDRLCAAVSLDAVRLDVYEGRRRRWCMAERDDEVIPDWVDDRSFEWSALMVANDPRKYGDPITGDTGLPSSSGGLAWPATWPITWDGNTETGILHVDNPGNIAVPVRLRVDGPCEGPFVRHIGTGTELTLSSAYTLPAGSWLEIDTGRKTILEGGTASRNGWVVQRGWFFLEEGPNDFIFGNSGAHSPDARLTLTATPAWQ